MNESMNKTITKKNRVVKLIEKIWFKGVGTDNKILRDKWLKNALSNISDGSKILDAGAGELQYKKYCKHLKYVSQDFGGYNGQGDKIALQTDSWDNSKLDIISDITNIPREDESFDAIMCIEVFEHLPDPARAIKEFGRLLKKDGTLIITAPFASLTHFAPYHFGSGYNKYFYEHHLDKNKFKTMEIKSSGNFFDYLAQEIRRVPMVKSKYSTISNKFTRACFYILVFGMLRVLSIFSKNDQGSGELLCYGYHVIAKKQ